ncbi:hypothetical protein HY642_05420 [Candidatus Woesearchaeota archaeon]|nr:hypothetical protein [Candidatus Woesearchaeota archaeon]
MADKPEKKPKPEEKKEPTAEEKRFSKAAEMIGKIDSDFDTSQLEHSVLKAYLETVEVKGKDVPTFKTDLKEGDKKKIAGGIYDSLEQHIMLRQFGLDSATYARLKGGKDKDGKDLPGGKDKFGTRITDVLVENYFGIDRDGLTEVFTKAELVNPNLVMGITAKALQQYRSVVSNKPIKDAKIEPGDVPALQSWIKKQPQYEDVRKATELPDAGEVYDLNRLRGYFTTIALNPAKKKAA